MNTPPNLQELAIGYVIPSIRDDLRDLRFKLYRTPKWRKIKRYRLFEKINKLEDDLDLQEHVWLDN